MCDKGRMLVTAANRDSTTSYSHFRDMTQSQQIFQFFTKSQKSGISMWRFLLLKMLCSSNKIHLRLTNVLSLLSRRVQEKQRQLLTHPWSSFTWSAAWWTRGHD